MGQKNFQEFWRVGSRVMVQRDDDSNGALVDLGVISGAVGPTVEPTTAQLYDGDGGFQQLVEEDVTRIDETWEITLHNFNPFNLALFFLANEPEAFTQPSGGDITDVRHTAVIGPGKYVKLKDANGNWVYNVDTVQVYQAGSSTALTDGTDYKFTNLSNGPERGFIEILEGGALSDGDPIDITMTMNSLTGKRLVYPHTAQGAIDAHAVVWYSRDNHTYQTVREADVSLSPTGSNLAIEEFSSMTLRAAVTSDITSTTQPAGRLLQAIGSVPS